MCETKRTSSERTNEKDHLCKQKSAHFGIRSLSAKQPDRDRGCCCCCCYYCRPMRRRRKRGILRQFSLWTCRCFKRAAEKNIEVKQYLYFLAEAASKMMIGFFPHRVWFLATESLGAFPQPAVDAADDLLLPPLLLLLLLQ